MLFRYTGRLSPFFFPSSLHCHFWPKTLGLHLLIDKHCAYDLGFVARFSNRLQNHRNDDQNQSLKKGDVSSSKGKLNGGYSDGPCTHTSSSFEDRWLSNPHMFDLSASPKPDCTRT